MKKIFTLCVVLCLSYLSMGATNLKHEFRATWLTTAWGNDWPKTKVTNDATRRQQQDSLIAIFDRLQAGNMNAVCLQVRGRSDAFYQSSYEPWAAELAGARGKDPGYDPLAFAIEEAHKRGLELHAWVNPFRVTSAGTLDANDLVKKNAGQWIIQYNNGSFTGEIIDPGYPEAREYVLNVLMEIINNYDIDGIVMDDYFYPYGGTTTEDAASKALHKPANVVDVNQDGYTDDDWRRSNVDVFLKELYDRIQAKKPWVRFGMGTFGIWTTQTKVAQAYGISLPSGISGLDDYDVQACNPVEWVKNGYVDYINPQLYWPTTSTGQNYGKLCQWWAKDVCEYFSDQLTDGKKVHFFSSQSISANPTLSEIQSEIDVNRNNLSSGSTGSVFFDTDAYLTMDNALMTSRFATHALPPAMDWKSNTALAAPTNLTVSGSTLTWQHATAERFTVYVYPKGTAWSTAKNDPSYLQGVIYGKSMDISGIDTNANDIAVCAYDRYGVEHTAAVYSNDSGTVTPPASGTITYELNGGMMNEFGWTSKNDMFQACMADCGVTTLPSLDEIKATGNDAALTTICTKLSDVSGMLNSDKWDWLEQYIMEVQNAQAGTSIGAGSVPVLTAGVTSAGWRYALAAFFIEGQRTTWPYSADFSQAGKDEAYIPAWKHVYTNPTSVTTEFTLYDPCREGYTFLGWYANADFSGEKVTTINAETTGTLYAKWINSDWIITYTSTDSNIVTPYATNSFGANIVSNTYENGVGTITFDGPVTSIGECAFLNRNFLYSITIPNRVTSLGDDAFCCCGNLTSIFIPNSVAYIESGAFSSCTSLASIVVEDNNEYYDNRNNCNAIIETKTNTLVAGCKNTIIPNSVTRIGDEAFNGCEFLPFISIPNSVTSIGSYAFYGCSSLTSITIPNSVTSIGKYAFYACRALTSMVIDSNNNHYDSRENCNAIIETATNTLISGCQNTIIPSSVTSIGARAFSLCNSLTSITIPNSVISIWDEAFEECSGLTSITIPNSVTNIGDKAFFYCSNLTSVIIGNSVTSIGNGAFSGCSKLNTIHVEATIPPALANSTVFMNTPAPVCVIPCGTLAAYETSDWASQVGEFVEEGCLTYELNGGMMNEFGWTSKDDMFQACMADCGVTTLPSLDEIKATGNDAALTTICAKLSDVSGMLNSDKWDWLEQYIMEVQNAQAGTSIGAGSVPVLTAGVTSAGWRYALAAFFIEGQRTTWPYSADFSQAGKDEAYIPAWKHVYTNPTSVTSEFTLYDPYRKGYTFLGWYTNADFSGEKVTTINAETTGTLYAKWINSDWIITYTSTDGNIITPRDTTGFGANIVSNTYDDGQGIIVFDGPVTSIGYEAFFGCSSLTSITIPNGVTSIGESAFHLCTSLTSVTLPNSVTSIGDYAFYQCTSLTSITLPNSVTRIGNGAFEYSSLTSITLPNSVTSIGDRAFSGCDSPISIVVEDGNATYDSRTNCNAIIETATNTLIAGCQNTIIPNSVTSIGDWAFLDCSSLTSITIPNSVTSIGSYAFHSCDGLTSITIPNSVTSIGYEAFFGCSSLTDIAIPNSVTSIGDDAFSYCGAITSMVVENGNTIYDSRENCNAIIETATNTLIAGCQNTIIPNSVTSIGGYAFRGCSSLTSITIPNGVTSIGDFAFQHCTSLTSITIPNSVTSIGEGAFQHCTSLTSITIPNSVTSIGDWAFGWCSSLTSITIPNSVTSIGEGAFYGCSSLDTIYVEATTPPALEDSTVFMDTPSPICVIPCGTLAAYEASDWANYMGEFVEEGCAPIQMCGDDLYWEYADGVLTITGTGEMYDYAADTDVPWYDVRGNIKTVSLPDAMTKIGQNAFYKCTNMTTINMPTSLTAIGEKAFAQDTKLACEIILPASMTTIASRAFFNCQAVTAFHIEATTPPTIPNDAFELTTAPIHVPCGYGHIYGKHTQWGMLNLEMCELLQDNVYYYPIDGHTARAVTYHSNPTDTLVIPSAVVIDGMPRTVTEVAASAFADCKDIPAIIFNEGLEYIGERAFVRCYGLHGTIVLPATLETIGERAFSYCDNVDRYTIQAMTPPVLGANVFTGNNKNALFYISCEAMDDYKVATNWSSLKSRLRDACLNIYHYNTALGANGVHTTEDTLVASIYYRRKFTTSRWETLYLPFEVDRVTVLEDGVEYDLNAWSIFGGGHYYLAKPYGIENKEIVFGFTQVVDAHTPYIIQFKEPYYHDKMITFHGKESWNKLNTSFEALPISFEMQMAGNTTLQDQILEEPVYMLRASSNFILQNTTTTLHPFECYVIPSATSSGAPARMSVRFRGDVPTAVESVMGNESRLAYTVDGYTLTVYPQGQAFSIYSLNGALIYSCEAGKEAVDCELNSGCYLLHAGTEAHKIML